MTTVYFAGGEDSEMYQVGGGSVSTLANSFRSAYARCSLQGGGGGTNPYWSNYAAFSTSSFWFGARHAASASQSVSNRIIAFTSVDGVERLQIVGTGAVNTYKANKVNTAGSATQLGSNFNMTFSGISNPDKLDVQIVNAVSGTFNVWLNGVSVFAYSGDTTTEDTTLTNIRVSNAGNSTAYWSELMLLDQDTRSCSLQTFAPTANGNTHNFDIGSPAASNVNEITLNDATLDGASASGLIDQYTCPAVATGTFSVLAFGVSARMQKGATGPANADLGVRTGSADYWSADKALATSWWNYQNWWTTNPNTAVPWLTSEIGAAAGFNIGLQSVT